MSVGGKGWPMTAGSKGGNVRDRGSNAPARRGIQQARRVAEGTFTC
jgi:hypothetical protein